MEEPIRRARRMPPTEEEVKEAADSVKEEIEEPEPRPFLFKDTDKVVSTGSDLLNLSILGGRINGGGLPGGIMVEIYSESGLGKTAIASEIAGFCQKDGGEVRFIDPEGRLDREYARIYGVEIPKENYKRLHLVSDIIDDFMAWSPANRNAINVYICDSLAALTTKMEMDSEDKMGMRRAKELSTLFRKGSLEIAEGHKLMVCTNQLREGDKGTFSPGGKAIGYWASIRIELKRITQYTKGQVNKNSEIVDEIEVGSKKRKVESTIGIRSLAKIAKNSCDSPYRTAPIAMVFGYGIDNIRENLQYIKDMTGEGSFICPDGKNFVSLSDAIDYTEKENLEEELTEQVIEIWKGIEKVFQNRNLRVPKRR